LIGPATLSAEIDEVPGSNIGASSFRLEVSREILSTPRASAARDVARVDLEIARIALKATERLIETRFNASLASAVAAISVARRLAAEDSLLARASETLTDRFSVGDARYVDVLRLRTERLRVQTERAQSVATMRAGRAQLLALAAPMGDPPLILLIDSAIARASRQSVVTEPPSPPPLDSLLATSALLQIAEADVRRTNAQAALVAAEQRTRIEANVGLQRFGANEGDGRIGPSLGATITLPFTARGSLRANTLVASRDVAFAEARHRALRASVASRLNAARERYEAARERILTFDAALLRGAREERESALASYRTGDITLLEFLDFERSLARAEIERLQTLTEAALALADIYAVAAGEIPDDFPLSGVN
jgi:outer membrane protein TolC